MTPTPAPRSWFSTIVGSFLCIGALVAHYLFPKGATEILTMVVIVVGGIMIQGERIVDGLRARFGKGDGAP